MCCFCYQSIQVRCLRTKIVFLSKNISCKLGQLIVQWLHATRRLAPAQHSHPPPSPTSSSTQARQNVRKINVLRFPTKFQNHWYSLFILPCYSTPLTHVQAEGEYLNWRNFLQFEFKILQCLAALGLASQTGLKLEQQIYKPVIWRIAHSTNVKLNSLLMYASKIPKNI